MPTPMHMRHPHESIDRSGEVPVVDGGDVLVKTIGPWHMWVGEVRHRFDPPARVKVTKSMADGLEKAGAAAVLSEPKKKRKPGRPRKTKALEPEENKSVE